ncbi:Helicase SKI2W, partial [Stegodyphus mimosarum]
MITGKLLGFCEEEKDIFEGTHKTSTSLSRAPGPPEAGVKGSTSSFPFWPGGMDEPWADLLKKESINKSLFEGDLLDTPPGFKCGMKFERKSQDEMDYMYAQPQKIYLSEVLSMDDTLDLEILNEIEETKEEVDLGKAETEKEPETIVTQDEVLKLTSLPVLNISETAPKPPAPKYEWAVIEDVKYDVEDFHERIPKMAYNWNFELDIFQKRAILHLERKESVFVAAHTSAGKTVVAEYAVALAKKNVTRVIYTSPIKALSNQKFREFKKSFEDVGLITGDVQINPTAFCLIMTTEILRSMLYHGSDVIRELEWVIFDEVHYINDTERGVVWEEVFIMLPDHVNLIMLSATVPNTADFAEWLGGIKKRKIYVIKTLKRPVPLIYHLYTGSVGKNEKNMFKIVDVSGKFLDDKYMEACRSKEKKDNKSKTTGPKGPKYTITPAQEKNVYIGLLEHLQKNDLLPAVCFTFSRKKCNEHAEMLTSQNLVTKEERNRIHKFFHQSITQLKKEDQQLPQIKLMEEQLERGFGVHHSGILPILKEIVELLFQDGLVKVLFATETFAMGVNMPARTVVFDSIRKHDGLNFRFLEPSEFIQMAGRAGRRGLDKEGIVIVLCKADVPDPISLRNMMLGQPTKLQSQFKLTYSMILNLLKIKTFRVEDVMKRSFGESDNQKQQKNYQALLHEATNKLNSVSELDCSICNIDINKYIQEVREARNLREEVMEKKCSQVANKLFTPGRVLVISNSQHQNVLGTLLDVDKENKCKVLVITEKKTLENCQNNTSKDILCPWTNKLLYPNEKQPEVLTITFREISVIGNKVLRIDEKDILKEWSK